MASTQLDLAADPDSPRQARRFVTECLQGWGHPHLAHEAELLMSELVTNVVRHLEAPLVVELVDLGDSVVIAVVDPVPELPPCPPPPPQAATCGRGLAIVHGLAAAWGAAPLPEDGKVVWARLPCRPRPSPGAGRAPGRH